MFSFVSHYKIAPFSRLLDCVIWLSVPSAAFAQSPTFAAEPYAPEQHDGFASLMQEATARIFESDFSLGATQWQEDGKQGCLPPGWQNFTSPSGGRGNFERLIFDGVPMFRIQAEKSSSGSGAFRAGIPIGNPVAGSLYKIRLNFRSTTRTPLLLSITAEKGQEKPLWSKTVSGSTGWREQEFTWSAPVSFPKAVTDATAHLVFALERSGSLDVIRCQVERVDGGQFEAALTRSPVAERANGFRVTRFPLGLPSRWMLDRSNSDDDWKIVADAAASGPSGSPSLHILPPPARPADQAQLGAVTLYGESFAVARFRQKHVVSFFIKGNATVKTNVCNRFESVAQKTFKVSAAEGWRRVALSFSPLMLSDEYYLKLQVNGELWIDGLRVAAGSENDLKAVAYIPPGTVEVALASPSPARVTFADDAADADGRLINWAVVLPQGGVSAGSVLRAKVVNLYGKQIRLPDTRLDGQRNIVSGHWNLPEFSGETYGAHRVEAWVEDGAGKRISPVDELVLYRLPRPKYWGQDGEDSFFGVHVNSTLRHVQMTKAVGANWVRLHDAGIGYIGWYFLEKERGRWTFRDDSINRYRDNHLMILGQLGTAPGWATAQHRAGPGDWLDRYYQPEDLEAWDNYVRTITSRYRDQIRYWDVWNEPWLSMFWKADSKFDAQGRHTYVYGENPPLAYAKLTHRTVAVARSVDPSIKLLGLNSTTGKHTNLERVYSGADWTRLVNEADGLREVDGLTYHFYQTTDLGHQKDQAIAGFKTAVGSLIEPGAEKPTLPVWMTEGSAVQSMTGRGFYYHSLPFPGADEDRGAAVSDQLVRYHTAILAAGAKKTFQYSLHKYGFFDHGAPFRALLSEDGYLHPSAVAYAALARRIDGRPFWKGIQLTPETRAYIFADRPGMTGEEGWTAVLMPRSFKSASTVSLQKRGALQVDDIFGNPLPPGAPTPQGAFFVSGKGTFSDSVLAALKP